LSFSDKENLDLSVLPGLSTTKKITKSSRGVGHGVLQRHIGVLRAFVLIASEKGKGTTGAHLPSALL
jgi:chemotaxis protein histidine kinase CheA